MSSYNNGYWGTPITLASLTEGFNAAVDRRTSAYGIRYSQAASDPLNENRETELVFRGE